MNEIERIIRNCAETGKLIEFPENYDKTAVGNLMGKIAGKYIDEGQIVKAQIILVERRRLNV